MSARNIRIWRLIHEWSSLCCTLVLLLTCATGLPLIFAKEIDRLFEKQPSYEQLPANTPPASLDWLIDRAKSLYPGQIVITVIVDDDEPQTTVWMAPSFESAQTVPGASHFIRFDSRTAKIIDQSNAGVAPRQTLTGLIKTIHVDLFADDYGELLIGSMGVVFMLSIVSGVVLYGPFTRKMPFGTVRDGRSQRVRWLDLHNLIGIVTLAWALVVGATGVMNELSGPLFSVWQRTDVREMLAPWQGKKPPSPAELVPLQSAADVASHALPGMRITDIIYPGSQGGSPHHYIIWGHGKTPLTARLFSPALVDARTGKLTAVVEMPWYLRALEISRPLHFGDYGGIPLKLLWALLDLATIIVLLSGVYLWITRRKSRRSTAAQNRSDVAGDLMS